MLKLYYALRKHCNSFKAYTGRNKCHLNYFYWSSSLNCSSLFLIIQFKDTEYFLLVSKVSEVDVNKTEVVFLILATNKHSKPIFYIFIATEAKIWILGSQMNINIWE